MTLMAQPSGITICENALEAPDAPTPQTRLPRASSIAPRHPLVTCVRVRWRSFMWPLQMQQHSFVNNQSIPSLHHITATHTHERERRGRQLSPARTRTSARAGEPTEKKMTEVVFKSSGPVELNSVGSLRESVTSFH